MRVHVRNRHYITGFQSMIISFLNEKLKVTPGLHLILKVPGKCMILIISVINLPSLINNSKSFESELLRKRILQLQVLISIRKTEVHGRQHYTC